MKNINRFAEVKIVKIIWKREIFVWCCFCQLKWWICIVHTFVCFMLSPTQTQLRLWWKDHGIKNRTLKLTLDFNKLRKIISHICTDSIHFIKFYISIVFIAIDFFVVYYCFVFTKFLNFGANKRKMRGGRTTNFLHCHMNKQTISI